MPGKSQIAAGTSQKAAEFQHSGGQVYLPHPAHPKATEGPDRHANDRALTRTDTV